MFLFSNKTLREKILIGFFVVIIIMVAITSWSIYNFFKISNSFESTINRNYASIIAADNMGFALDNHMSAMIVIFKANVTEGLLMFESSKTDFIKWYKTANESAYTKREQMILDTLNLEYNTFVKRIYDIDFAHLDKKKINYEQQLFIESIESVRLIKKRCNELFDINHGFMNASIKSINEITRTATIYMLIIVSVGIILSFVFVFLFSDYLVKPILQLTRSVRYVSRGNFDQWIPINTFDEIGTLTIEFNKMSQKLDKYEKLNVSKILYEKSKADAIIEKTNEPIVFTDSSLNIVTANKTFRQVFGEVTDAKNNLELFVKDKRLIEELKNCINISDYEIKENLLEFNDEQDEKKYLKLIYSLIEIPDSGMKGLVIVFNDVTKYRELDLMKTEFIGKVSHELKTPLTSIGMAIGMLDNEVPGKINKKQRTLINTIKSDYIRLNKLVYEILELTKIESKKMKMEFEDFNVETMINEMKDHISLQCKEKELELQVSIEKSPIILNGNMEYLSRACENILSNSIKFTDPGGKISIRIKKEESQAVFEISDTGKGIHPDDVEKIFDKFSQIENNTPGSIGLGLSIAKEIIDLHNGTIEVDSNPGEGTKFTIKLPVV